MQPLLVNIKPVQSKEIIPWDTNWAGGFIAHNYIVKLNDTWVPINQTLFEIPEINYSLTFAQEKELSGHSLGWPGYDIGLQNLTKQTGDKDNQYYYVCDGYIELSGATDYGFESELVFFDLKNVTIKPFELNNYFYAFFYRLLDAFTTNNTNANQEMSYQEIMSVWRPHKLIIPFVIKNNSVVPPLIGPTEGSYYENMANEGQNIAEQIKNNNFWKNNWTHFYWGEYENPEVPPLYAYKYFVFNTSVFIDKEGYRASIRVAAALNLNIYMQIFDFLMISNLVFYDKNSHTKIAIEEDFSIVNLAIPKGVSGQISNDDDEFLSLDLKLLSFPLIVMVIVIKKRRKNYDT